MNQATLKLALLYTPETGEFVWVNHPRRTTKNGSRAGSRAGDGYWRIMLARKEYPAHRLAWLYVTGEWPIHQIDHINGNRDDNRFCNLRDVTPRENRQNMRVAQRNNRSSGLLGVTRQGNIWVAQISSPANGSRYLGSYPTPEEAHAAYLRAKRDRHVGCAI